MPPSNESAFTIPTADLDTSLLPEHARVPGTDAFRDAVTDLIRNEYGKLGGRATVVIDDTSGTMQVTWRPGADRPDPLDVAVAKLESGQYRKPSGCWRSSGSSSRRGQPCSTTWAWP